MILLGLLPDSVHDVRERERVLNTLGDPYALRAQALDQARAAFDRGEVPVGAAIVDPASNKISAAAGNRTETSRDPTAHAEIVALREAAKKIGSERLVETRPFPTCASEASVGVDAVR